MWLATRRAVFIDEGGVRGLHGRRHSFIRIRPPSWGAAVAPMVLGDERKRKDIFFLVFVRFFTLKIAGRRVFAPFLNKTDVKMAYSALRCGGSAALKDVPHRVRPRHTKEGRGIPCGTSRLHFVCKGGVASLGPSVGAVSL